MGHCGSLLLQRRLQSAWAAVVLIAVLTAGLSGGELAWAQDGRPATRIVLVLDQSTSMRETDPTNARVVALRDYVDTRINTAGLTGRPIELVILHFGGRVDVAMELATLGVGRDGTAVEQGTKVTVIPNTDFLAALCGGWSQAAGQQPPGDANCPAVPNPIAPAPAPGMSTEVVLVTDGLPAPQGQDLIFRPADRSADCSATVPTPSEGHRYMCALEATWNRLAAVHQARLSVRYYDPTPEQRIWETVKPYWCRMATIGEVCDAGPGVPLVPPAPPYAPGQSYDLCQAGSCSVDHFTEQVTFSFYGLSPNDAIGLWTPEPGSFDLLQFPPPQVRIRRQGSSAVVEIPWPRPGVWRATSSSPQARLQVGKTQVLPNVSLAVSPNPARVGDMASVRASVSSRARPSNQPAVPPPASAIARLQVVRQDDGASVFSDSRTFTYNTGNQAFELADVLRYDRPGQYQFDLSVDVDGRAVGLGQVVVTVSAPATATPRSIAVPTRVPTAVPTSAPLPQAAALIPPKPEVRWSISSPEWLVDTLSPRLGWPIRLSTRSPLQGTLRLLDEADQAQVHPLRHWFGEGARPVARLVVQHGNREQVWVFDSWNAETSELILQADTPDAVLDRGEVVIQARVSGQLRSGESWDAHSDPLTFRARRTAWAAAFEDDYWGYVLWLLPTLGLVVLVSALSVRLGTVNAK